MGIIENYRGIRDNIKKICDKCGRNPEEIKIIAVSKTFPAASVQEAIDRGIKLFGENRVQEARDKIRQLKGDFEFHLIGHLQSNKAKDAIRLFSNIQSVDKFSTAEKLNEEAEKIGKVQNIMIQVNTSGEITKSGAHPDKAVGLVKEILTLKNLDVRGLMTIGPFTDDKQKIRESFNSLRRLLEKANTDLNIQLKELSMGMSSDYQIAVEEGATIVRIGNAIFGNRDYSA